MRLAETRAALRRNLSGATADWTDEVLDGGVARAVDDLDRVLPLEKLADFTSTFQVTDETWNSGTLGTAITLANERIRAKSETVKSTDGATSYTRDTDYTMDYAAGKITALAAGSIPGSTNVYISYYIMEVYVDISSLTDLIRVSRMEYPAGNVPATFQPFYTWGDYLVITARGRETQQKMAENEHVWVYYHAKHTTPLVAVEGSWSPQLDEVVIKGAEGYSLITKALELRHSVRTRLNTASTTLGEIDAIETKISASLVSSVSKATDASADLDLIDTRLDDMAAALAAVATFLASAGASLTLAATQAGQAASDIATAVGAPLTSAESKLATVDTLIANAINATNNAAAIASLAGSPLTNAMAYLTEIVTLIRASGSRASGSLLAEVDIGRAYAIARLGQGAGKVLDADPYFRSLPTAILNALNSNLTNLDIPITKVSNAITAAGNHLIAAVAATDKVNVGEIVSEMYRRHADSYIAVGRLEYEAWLTWLGRVDRLFAQGGGVLSEAAEYRAQADGYLAEVNTILGEVNALLGQISGFHDNVARHIDTGQAFINEGQVLANVAGGAVGIAGRGIEQANSYVGVARVQLDAASESSNLVNSHAAIAAQYVNMAQAKIAEGTALRTPIDAILERAAKKIEIARVYQQESDRRLQELNLKQQEADRYMVLAVRESELADKFDEVGVRVRGEFMGILLDRSQVRADTALAPTRQEAP